MCKVLKEMVERWPWVSYPIQIHEQWEMLFHSISMYAHNNQPVHHVLYMFAHAGCPMEGQRHIFNTLHSQYGEFGYTGDEDNGEVRAIAYGFFLRILTVRFRCPAGIYCQR